ncbi:sulfatase [Flammeovirga sp. MY04]|uniref:sulfatase family protein n=1 Tax=Flammeovirga sp. MY04 TaxID=1191459 RepID=UPI0008063835|nr:sulfatase [Flammeovirga sp. MY04]ANQ52572.1 sulfatase [Flammeovirga sp. MY04]
MKKIFLYTLMFTLGISCLISCSSKPEKIERPNILFCIADDAGLHMGAYGAKFVKTPAFDRIADQGILFMNAYTPNPKCGPSRTAVLTGRNSWQLEQGGNHAMVFPQKFKTIMETLEEHNYHVGYGGKGWGPGDPGTINGKPRLVTGNSYNKFKKTPPAKQMSSDDYAKNFEYFLSQNTENKPWMFWYGSREPHRRYEFKAGVNKGGKKLSDISKEEIYKFWPDNDTVRHDLLDYAFEIEHSDDHLGQMLALLEENGQLDNTIIVVTSDNGMPFPRVKGSEYERAAHLPLAIMWPKGIKNPGRIENDFVSFIDFAPTFLEISGITEKESKMASITGKSMTDIFNQEKKYERDFVLLGKERHDIGRPNNQGYPIRGIVKDNFMFLHNYETDRYPHGNPETGYLNTDGSPTKTWILNDRRQNGHSVYWDLSFGKRGAYELYDIEKDPDCLNNLALEDNFQGKMNELKTLLKKELIAQNDPRMFGKGEIFDNYPFANKDSWNFYEEYMKGTSKAKTNWVNPSDFEEKNFILKK